MTLQTSKMNIKKVDKISSIRVDTPDDIFITCGSFEDRFLCVPQKISGKISENFIMFKFTEPNSKREKLIDEMERMLDINRVYQKGYYKINIEHGKSIEAVIEFHKYLQKEKLSASKLNITMDISTFSKDLLFAILYYLNNFMQIERLRILYTIPGRYASPDEGGLSYGIKNIHYPPMYWNSWSPIKENLLIVILGYEEMRAWSLIDKFNANTNYLFVTSPGSRKEWDNYCEEYNQKLLSIIPQKDTIPALDPIKTYTCLSKYITKDLVDNYNLFIAPLGTKHQIIGIIYFCNCHPDIPINIITTTVEHNCPYYSWGIGDTYEFFFPIKNGEQYEQNKKM
jgi:hypothetical protein